ncbi:hypothetical protein A6R68_10932 [Neotoma lepida]|uniref:Uncharacterized protein n=1 Tax=Neotoma lepida TaxID=56216 RepID=A0A1A6FWL9_NEOLE|nr:hypothetical protein A6R68_10932 [Neotoma lepida]
MQEETESGGGDPDRPQSFHWEAGNGLCRQVTPLEELVPHGFNVEHYLPVHPFPVVPPVPCPPKKAETVEPKTCKCRKQVEDLTRRKRTKFIACDFLTEWLYKKRTKFIACDFLTEWLYNPRPPIPLSLLLTEEEAAVTIQSFWRAYLGLLATKDPPTRLLLLHSAKVRCDPEIQELRQWQKKLREDKYIRQRVKVFWAKQEQKSIGTVLTLYADNKELREKTINHASPCFMLELPKRYMVIQTTQMNKERKVVMRMKAPFTFHRLNLPHSVKRDCVRAQAGFVSRNTVSTSHSVAMMTCTSIRHSARLTICQPAGLVPWRTSLRTRHAWLSIQEKQSAKRTPQRKRRMEQIASSIRMMKANVSPKRPRVPSRKRKWRHTGFLFSLSLMKGSLTRRISIRSSVIRAPAPATASTTMPQMASRSHRDTFSKSESAIIFITLC